VHLICVHFAVYVLFSAGIINVYVKSVPSDTFCPL